MFVVFVPFTLILCLLCCSLYADDFKGSKLGTTSYNKEMQVIEKGKLDYAKTRESPNFFKRKKLLCATFIYANGTASSMLAHNVRVMQDACDWAIIIYGGSAKSVTSTCKDPRIADNIIHCRRNEVTLTDRYMPESPAVKLSVPKTVMYHDLLPYLPNYERVFLMDEDISLKNFNMTTFMLFWKCSFYPTPLIVQPLVYESNQYISYMNLLQWRRSSAFNNVMATSVGLIEQQVPMFDAIFFEWFVRHVLTLTKDIATERGVDWGHDRSWCNAAKMYATQVLGHHAHKDLVVCALFPHAPPIHHLNLRSMKSKRDNREAFHANGVRVVQHYINLFPTWVETDILAPNNPLDSKNGHKYPKMHSLNRRCLRKGERKSAHSAPLTGSTKSGVELTRNSTHVVHAGHLRQRWLAHFENAELQ
jgi:hypothetical protein